MQNKEKRSEGGKKKKQQQQQPDRYNRHAATSATNYTPTDSHLSCLQIHTATQSLI